MPTFSPVLSHPPPDSGPYIRRWAEGLRAAGSDVEELTLSRLARSPQAVVHVHWPEHLVRPGASLGVLLRLGRAVLLFLLMIVQKNRVVWTVHNLAPHSGWRLVDRLVIAALHRTLTGVVVTTKSHADLVVAEFPRLSEKAFVQIPLVALDPGSVGERPSKRRSGPLRLLQFGTIAPYRGQAVVVEALENKLLAADCEVTVVGRWHDAEYLADLEHEADRLPGLRVHAGHVDDAELRRLMFDTDAVIGIQVDGLNTGVLPAALPLGIPVISADTLQAAEIQRAVGEEWVFILRDVGDPACWDAAVEWALKPRDPWTTTIFDVHQNGQLHAEFYEQLSGAR